MTTWGAPRHGFADDPRSQIAREIFEHGAGPVGPRRIVGFVYEAILRDQAPGTHAYIGKVMGATQAAVTERFHGGSPSAHTSPESIRRDPWKARILPGRSGYRILERIRDTGDPEENDRAVRRAEAFWIDRLRPEFNVVRPVRPPATVRQPAPRPRKPAPARGRAAGRDWRRALAPAAIISLMIAYAVSLAVFLHMGGATGPIAWVLPPAVSVFLTWRTVTRVERRPRRRRRR